MRHQWLFCYVLGVESFSHICRNRNPSIKKPILQSNLINLTIWYYPIYCWIKYTSSYLSCNITTYFLVLRTILCNYCTYGIRCKYINKSCFINLHQNFVNDVSAVQRRCRCFFHATVTIYHNDNIQHDSFTLNSTKTQQNMLPLLYIHYTRVSTLLLLISFSL